MRSNRRVGYTFTYLDDDVVPNLEFEDFDITDHDLFLTTAANSVYARNRFVTDRRDRIRSEEHTSELQSLMRISYAVFCLKQNMTIHQTRQHVMQQHTHITTS